MSALRKAWPVSFPRIVVHTTVKVRDSHADYVAAKTGNANAAARLARDLLSERALAELRAIIGNRAPILAAATAEEAEGFNAIPDTMGRLIAERLGLTIETDIVQTNVVAHTRADGFHRLAFRAELRVA